MHFIKITLFLMFKRIVFFKKSVILIKCVSWFFNMCDKVLTFKNRASYI
jgi:hypothetical protein